MVTRSRAWEGRGINVAPEVPVEPEVEMRPEPEITSCEVGLGATRSYPTDTALFTFAEIVTAHASQKVTETSLISTAPSQTASPSHTASQTSGSHNIYWVYDFLSVSNFVHKMIREIFDLQHTVTLKSGLGSVN